MKNRISLMVAAGFAALAVTTAAQYTFAGDDGIAASPKVRQMLNEQKAYAAPAVAAAPAMACPMCTDVLATQVNRQAKGGEILAGAATRTVAMHGCNGCETKMSVAGEGKAKQTVASHKCVADVSKSGTCCASN